MLEPEEKASKGAFIPLPIKVAFLAIVTVAAITFFLLFPPLLADDLKIRILIGLLLSVLAGLVASAMLLIIYQARKEALLSKDLMRKISSQRQDLQTLFAISKTITTTMQLKPLLEKILAILMPIVDARSAVLWLVDQGKLKKCWEEMNCVYGDCPAFHSTDHRCWSFSSTLCSWDHAASASLGERIDECVRCPVLSRVTLNLAAAVGSVPGVDEPPVVSLGDSMCRNVLLQDPKILVFHSYPPKDDVSPQSCFRQVEWVRQDTDALARYPKLVEAQSCFDEVIDTPMTRIGMALMTKNQIHGLLCLGLDRIHYVTDDEVMLLTNAAALAAAAIENADLYYHMEKRNQQITTLLKEAHHRIKNNLQAIVGLSSMQLQQTTDPEALRLILDNLTRIRSIALVHQLLSQEDVKFVNVAQMIGKVMDMIVQLLNGAQKHFAYEISGTDVKVTSQKATSLALIANELATNSIKHGFADRASGRIVINVSGGLEGEAAIAFTDDGCGLPEGFCIEMYKSLGLQLVSNLVQDDLNGTFTLACDNGETTAMVRFPL